MGGMGDDRLNNNCFGINCLRFLIAGICAWLVVLPAGWACFGSGQFGGIGGNNPCLGLEGGLFWKIIISILGIGYNLFGFLIPSSQKKGWAPSYNESWQPQWSTYDGHGCVHPERLW